MISYLETPAGQAWSTLLSNGLSLLAIAIGVVVALLEQRRSNADAKREQAREREAIERVELERGARRARLQATALNLLDRAMAVMQTDLPAIGEMYTTWLPDRGKPLELRTIKATLEALRSAALDDVELILGLSKASAILDVAIRPSGMDSAPPVKAVLRVLLEQSTALDEVRESILRASVSPAVAVTTAAGSREL